MLGCLCWFLRACSGEKTGARDEYVYEKCFGFIYQSKEDFNNWIYYVLASSMKSNSIPAYLAPPSLQDAFRGKYLTQGLSEGGRKTCKSESRIASAF